MPAVSITTGPVLTTRRMPPKPQALPASREASVQQSPTKAVMQVGRAEEAAAPGFRHCRHRESKVVLGE